jgi:hypothetical protein
MSRIYRRFSPSEDQLIRAGLPIAHLASRFRRQRMTVHRRAVKLGLKGLDRIVTAQERT